MFELKSNIDTGSGDFKQNHKEYLALLSEFRNRLREVQKGGSEAALKKHKSRKKLLARERIDLLVDRNTPFPFIQTVPESVTPRWRPVPILPNGELV